MFLAGVGLVTCAAIACAAFVGMLKAADNYRRLLVSLRRAEETNAAIQRRCDELEAWMIKQLTPDNFRSVHAEIAKEERERAAREWTTREWRDASQIYGGD